VPDARYGGIPRPPNLIPGSDRFRLRPVVDPTDPMPKVHLSKTSKSGGRNPVKTRLRPVGTLLLFSTASVIISVSAADDSFQDAIPGSHAGRFVVVFLLFEKRQRSNSPREQSAFVLSVYSAVEFQTRYMRHSEVTIASDRNYRSERLRISFSLPTTLFS